MSLLGAALSRALAGRSGIRFVVARVQPVPGSNPAVPHISLVRHGGVSDVETLGGGEFLRKGP
ncbi:MAG: hypothetical protein AAGJ92_05005 [Pseudomonadota bacterium]